MSGRIAATSLNAKGVKLKDGRVEKTRVKRYWPGKAPEWAEDDSDDEFVPGKGKQREVVAPAVILAKGDDPRLRRLQAQGGGSDDEEDGARRREISRAQILARRRQEEEAVKEEEEEEEGEEEEDDAGGDAGAGREGGADLARRVRQRIEDEEDDDDEEDQARRREMARLRFLQRQKEEEAAAAVVEEEDEEEGSEEESESEYETDSEDEDGGRAMLKPVFVPKKERETIAEREKLEAEEREAEEKERAKRARRKEESRQLVVDQIRREEEEAAQKTTNHDVKDVDTDDESNEQEEYELWKARELARIKADREERDAIDKEREEMERVRRMTDEERAAWEAANPKQVTSKVKEKWNFMQKYYHKGAFFQESADDKFGTTGADEIYGRDYSAPTGEDRIDKSLLPKVMQVKNFGRAGRTKYTHLKDQDTTDFETPWMQNDAMRAKYNQKMAGVGDLGKPKFKG